MRTRLTMMLGEVPTSVINPPSREPNDIGIRKEEGEVPDLFETWKAAGIIIASAPIFLTRAERKVTEPTRRRSCDPVRLIPLERRATAASITPERSTAAEMTSAEATMMTMSSEKPEKACFGLTMPSRSEASRARTATIS